MYSVRFFSTFNRTCTTSLTLNLNHRRPAIHRRPAPRGLARTHRADLRRIVHRRRKRRRTTDRGPHRRRVRAPQGLLGGRGTPPRGAACDERAPQRAPVALCGVLGRDPGAAQLEEGVRRRAALNGCDVGWMRWWDGWLAGWMGWRWDLGARGGQVHALGGIEHRFHDRSLAQSWRRRLCQARHIARVGMIIDSTNSIQIML